MKISKINIQNLQWGSFPRFTISQEELSRLQSALNSQGTASDIVRERILRADQVLEKEISYPKLGGQHNQWYQCRRCQRPLEQDAQGRHTCPECKGQYKGKIYDSASYRTIHEQNIKDCLDCAWAFALTEDEKYAQKAVEILFSYSQKYSDYPTLGNTRNNLFWKYLTGGRLGSQTLDEAYFLGLEIAPACDLLMNSKAMTKEKKQSILNKLVRPMLKVLRKYPCGMDNWQTFHITAFIAGAALLEEKEWLEKAFIDKGWFWGTFVSGLMNIYCLEKWKPGWSLGFQLKNGISADGFWYESSWWYHYYTAEAVIRAMEYGRRLGLPLWESEDFKKMMLLPRRLMFPDSTLPELGDSCYKDARDFIETHEAAAHAYGADNMAGLLPEEENWFSILYGRSIHKAPQGISSESCLLPQSGLGIIRTKGVHTALSFGPHGGFHSHFDTLSFMIHDGKKERLIDSGKAKSQAYGLPVHKKWYRASLSHNVVLVNGKKQRASRGKLLSHEKQEGKEIVCLETDQAYKGVLWKRSFVQGEGYLLLIDSLSSKKECTFDQIFHVDGEVITGGTSMEDCDLSLEFDGGEFLSHGKKGSARQGDEIQLGNTSLILSGEAELFTATGRRESKEDQIPFIAFRRKGKKVEFKTLIIPDCSKYDRTAILVELKKDDLY